ncbi:MAG: hypothetical protein COU63_02425 [Candidatus Pacebacteria bacterium CG10_big_fil_rev_8_21_14_0_10_36_11]|nr:class I SAM-dependent methyltransferase [Candidatus Pacearchaeota archaeon]OIP73570.1 MAG: hypothetical protein AUK08_03290 [Candidatus Pacebacteria bacterium CG2_30_36_39]PIR64849.1 MAG: hypothetical protein COU63_02425 [Candidatus Pacebacteria bacterium CG10_big_fil_rev_8_21_14_0_10_36_11]PJC42458.1 MAG: hypothetical protein CO040_04350 [Candidatus Pacebacteria bacterium CG_4_9_14_0_2_um_filter_36_8]
MPVDNKFSQLNRKAYNQMASRYFGERGQLRSDVYVRRFEGVLPRQAMVLDVGCGAGVPVDDYLIKKGHLVTGIDISETQIQLARKNCPRGAYFVRDLLSLKDREFQVDGIICVYTLFHLPKENHLDLLRLFSSFLSVGGKLLISMGVDDFEGEHELHGERVWSSHYDANRNRELVQMAGFELLMDKVDRTGNEEHLFVLASKM